MRLHSDILNRGTIIDALQAAKAKGHVTHGVQFYILDGHKSRSRSGAYEIQLGTAHKVKGDGRGWKNSGTNGAGDTYAATRDEWGWFIDELFEVDPNAVFGQYKGRDDFHAQTRYAYGV